MAHIVRYAPPLADDRQLYDRVAIRRLRAQYVPEATQLEPSSQQGPSVSLGLSFLLNKKILFLVAFAGLGFAAYYFLMQKKERESSSVLNTPAEKGDAKSTLEDRGTNSDNPSAAPSPLDNAETCFIIVDAEGTQKKLTEEHLRLLDEEFVAQKTKELALQKAEVREEQALAKIPSTENDFELVTTADLITQKLIKKTSESTGDTHAKYDFADLASGKKSSSVSAYAMFQEILPPQPVKKQFSYLNPWSWR